MFDLALLFDARHALLQGALLSCTIALGALFIGIVGGTITALLFFSGPVTRFLAHLYVTVIRGTPMLIQLVIFFYVLPLIGLKFSALWSAVIAIGCNSAAYMSQIMRAGIQAVGRGQIEAAKTLGFTRAQTLRLIVFPQALRIILPALGNECITLIKDSSLASVIGVAELTYNGSVIMSRTFDALTVYFGVAMIYLCLTSVVALLLYALERKLHYVGN